MSTDPLADLEALEAEEEAAAQENSEPEPEAEVVEPELILGKFKTTDDVIQSYAELERMNTQTRQELASEQRLREQYERIAEQAQSQPAQVSQDQQQYLPDGSPYYSDDQFAQGMQQAMDIQDAAQLNYLIGLRSHRDTQLAIAAQEERMRSEFAPLQQSQKDRDAQATMDVVTQSLGADRVAQMTQMELQALQRIGSALDGATPQETGLNIARYIRGIDAEKGIKPPAETRTRDPRTGKFVADERAVHVEGGSSPQPSGEPGVDDDIQELLSYRENADLFGRR